MGTKPPHSIVRKGSPRVSFTIHGEHPRRGGHSEFARETAAGAVFKAADLIGDGWMSVHISDEKNKIYWPDQFDQLGSSTEIGRWLMRARA
jgi:hypothetical protein